MSGSIKGIIVEIGGDTSGLQNALKKVNSSTSSLSKELKGINSLLKLDPKNTELVSQKQTVLKQNIEQTSKKLEELRKAQEMADKTIADGGEISEENYRNLQREIINTENKLKQLKLEASRWTQAGKSIEEFGEKITNISNKVSKMGTTLTTRLTLPILGIATAAINSAREFETAFTGVEKTVDGTATQMANLKQGIKDMSEEIPASTTEIAGVAEAAGQLGIQTDNVLSFTKTMINMGNATNLSADEAATTLARFANVTKMSQSDFDKLGSVIVALGNNFATTEAEITAMGMNLASAGTQVGMSQSQIMALATALSSVGLEAQAGGTAFSKVMVNMQLAVEKGGKELKDFATVAGMSTKEFQKAFKEDATSAIMKFVDGLSKSGEQGKSAIKILDDMGITETRLRDALLRSANASDVMGKAIELGNQAWEENTALTNEANKRYQTLDSRLEMTKNKIKNVASNTGDKLMPTFNKLLEKVEGLIDKFDGLNEEETKNIIKIAGIVAAIGPAIKILSTFGGVTGGTIKGIGTLSQTMGVLKTGVDSTNVSANTLAKGISGLISPAGLVTVTLAGMAIAIGVIKAKVDEEYKSLTNLNKELESNNNARKQTIQSIEDEKNSRISEINYTESLRKELQSLTDENGRVKEGYEQRAQFILTELNKALGTEYSMTGNMINKYQELMSTIDEVIQKKKAQVILESDEKAYAEAINNKDKLYKDYIKSIDELTNKQKRLKELEDERSRGYIGSKKSLYENTIETQKLSEEIKNLAINISDEEETLSKYSAAIKRYGENYELMLQGGAESYKKIEESIATTQQKITDVTNAGLNERLKAQIEANEQSKKEYILEEKYNEDAKNSIYATNLQKGQENLSALTNELMARTSTIGNLGEDEINAWRTLANSSEAEYNRAISKMSPDMQNEINKITGRINQDTSVRNATETLGNKATSGFNNIVDGYRWGTDLVLNIAKGLTSSLSISSISSAANTVGQIIADFLKHSTPKKGPMQDDDIWMSDFIDNLARGLEGDKNKVLKPAQRIAEELQNTLYIPKVNDFGKIQGGLSNQIIDSTKTIFTTPQIVFNVQELDKVRLQQCFDYINKKFGSVY